MTEEIKKITVRSNGPYIVRGGIPLVRKVPVMSEHGEPLTWEKEFVLSTPTMCTVFAGVDIPAQSPSATALTPWWVSMAMRRPTPVPSPIGPSTMKARR